MAENKIKISSIVQNQLPDFVRSEFPLVSEFLQQYYLSVENQGSSYDLISNLDKYVKVDTLSNLIASTTLSQSVSFVDNTITVESTAGFPDTYGLLQIDSEIITYTSKTSTTFEGCIRGFSGVTSLKSSYKTDELVFSESNAANHNSSSSVKNLSILFLQEFFKKLKTQIAPGFENRSLYSELNKGLFLKQSKDFYSSKGTDNSFEILFRALYGKDVEVIKPRDYVIEASRADYRETKDLVVLPISGNVEDLENTTIYQDSFGNIPAASGTVSKVERIFRGGNDYYQISLDFGYQRDIDVNGTISGEFSVHPQTQIITPITDTVPDISVFVPNSTTLDVDSTVGFPNSGELVLKLENGIDLVVSYKSKTLNQFIDCTGINQIISAGTYVRQNVYAYGNTNSGIVKFFITGVLSDFDVSNAILQKPNYPIKIKTLGEDLETYKANNWFFNIATKYDVRSINLRDSSLAGSYEVTFYDPHSFKIGDVLDLVSGSSKYRSTVISFNNEKTIIVRTSFTLDLNKTYQVFKILSRVNSSNYPELKKYTTNVQNVYADSDQNLYVTAPSLPTYLNEPLNVQDFSKEFSGTFSGTEIQIGKHSFYTGDSVYYVPGSGSTLGISTGYYFIKRVNDTTIKLSRSRPNIVPNDYVTVNGTASKDLIDFADYYGNTLEPQKIIRKLSDPKDNSIKKETESGMIGVLVNGVEILNYKSEDSISYGPIEDIYVTSSGSGYDVINPPLVDIIDTSGVGATVYASVVGSLTKINIVDPGFDYVETPSIIINGGNGSGASAKANLISFDHSVSFNPTASGSRVNLTNNTISFSSDHKFRDNESVIYNPNGGTSVGGLTTNAQYFVSVQNSTTIKLHKNESDSVIGINTISLTSYGVGNHTLKSTSKKKKIGSISIQNSGSGYSNNKTVAKVSGISTALDTISIKNHGYKSGEILTYETTGTVISGLSTSLSYYVSVVDEDSFKLSSVGVGTTNVDYFYKTNQFIDLKSSGSGLHIFNYEPITVTVTGQIGVSTLSNQNFNATLQPIFRGGLNSIFVQDGGSKYGSQEILNYVKEPQIILRNGSGAILSPVVDNGTIVDVVINSSGSYYNSPPDLIVNGSGYGAILTPIISNGTIIDVKIISGGGNYSPGDTTISVISAGAEAKLQTKIKHWNVNIVERYVQSNRITSDDGFVYTNLDKFGLQYCHPYAPRKLRSSVLGTRILDGKTIYDPDLVFVNNTEKTSISHSPIIGWAYDGNPIYGPYGYDTPTGGNIRSMVSGYQLKQPLYRPSTNIYPLGFFVEDYEFLGNGDLDVHNGRYCITPEYPNGVYAYFATISDSIVGSGPFRNYRKPSFPYFIGKTYKSEPIEYNFLGTSNQDYVDINSTGWLRNTNPYNLIETNSGYDYLFEPNKEVHQNSVIQSTSSGQISSVGILSAGINYKVDDTIRFSLDDLGSIPPKVKVSHVSGKTIDSISVATSSISNVEFYKPTNNSYIAIATSPHGFNDLDRVVFTAKNEFVIPSVIDVESNSLSLNVGVGTAGYTGIVTYFPVSGNISDIFENDVYSIGDEQVKVLYVDQLSSRIKVLRNHNGTSGIVSYTSGQRLTELPRKMNLLFNPKNNYDLNIRNYQYYFDPSETIGIGTTSGVGITSTLYFSNPGAGITQVTIPTRSLRIPSHQLKNGDQLIYSSGGGTGVSISTDGTTSSTLQEDSVVYATRLSNDLVGISTVLVGLNSIGEYVGLGTYSGGLLYFTNVGSGVNHSFTTNYPNVISGTLFKNEVTVSTSSTHGLSLKDTVFMNVKSGISTTITVQYNDYNQRLVVNPRSFVSGDVDIARNQITIQNHGFFTGQKIIHTSSSPSGGLENQKMYYVVVVDNDTIKLSNIQYFSVRKQRNIVDITSASSGNVLPINPPINLVENQTVIFNLSDSSLSFIRNSVKYPSFELNFYYDKDLTNKFVFSNSNSIEISKTGIVGTDATLTFRINDNTPRVLYYSLDPINIEFLPDRKNRVLDEEVTGNNEVIISPSFYSGEKTVVGVSSTSFSFIENEKIESSLYTKSNSEFSYHTNSKNAFGPIHNIKINYPGKYLKELPLVDQIETEIGSGALLETNSKDIGSVLSTNVRDIGFQYPSDFSVRPTAKSTTLWKVSPSSRFKSIGISSVGVNYLTPPNLVVIDGLTKKIVQDTKLKYNLQEKKVDIIVNTQGISDETPKIIPVNNSNGVKISNIIFNSGSNDVVVTLGSSFSDAEDFPFNVGDKVLIESVSIENPSTTVKGYNSSNYDYTLFTITATDPNIGGVGATVAYNMTDIIGIGQTVGTFDSENSFGRIVPEKYFPIFDISLDKNDFFIGETVTHKNSTSEVVEWDSTSNLLKVSTTDKFDVGNTVTGRSSGSKAVIDSITETDVVYSTGAVSIIKRGWEDRKGFLDDRLQRVHDNDYYQYFSYDLRSEVSYDTWENDIKNMNHTAGFKEFSNLIIESSDKNDTGISTNQNNGDFTSIVDFSSFFDVNCYPDFDLVSENNVTIDGQTKSNEILFGSRILQDYIESIGNRVLIIDDISSQFSDSLGPNFTIVDTFPLTTRSTKYLTYVEDAVFSSQAQVSLVSLLHDDSFGYINQYGRTSTDGDLGTFDFTIFGNEGRLLFYPQNYVINDYNIATISFDILDTTSGIGSTSFGDTVVIGTATTTIPSGTSSASTIIGISSTYRSSKVLVQIAASDSSRYEFNEITVIHDGSDVYIQEYGETTTDSFETISYSGIGTYDAYYSGSDVNIVLIPNSATSVDYDVNSVRISIANTSLTSVGSTELADGDLSSHYTSIPSSGSPGITTIATYSSNDRGFPYNGAYYVVSVEDLTNNQYQVSEVAVCHNPFIKQAYITEFGVIETGSSIGSIGATVTSSGNVDLTFEPNPSTEVQVRVYQQSIGLVDSQHVHKTIDLTNAVINDSHGFFLGAQNTIRKSFDLKHKQKSIFQRYFDGSSSSVIDTSNNIINIPDHFFVTGEKVNYQIVSSGFSTEPIGIATTTIPGIGSTDKLPGSVYIVKVNDLSVQVAASASEALSRIPNVLQINSVGIGTLHTFTSTNQNAKALISIDNHIQEPIISTAVTTTAAEYVNETDVNVTFSGITSFFGGNLFKVNDEIMRINTVGVGSTNVVAVRRGWVGTGIGSHPAGSLITKIQGNYNIVGSTVHFADSPYGLRPIASTTNPPSERDWVGVQTHSTFSGRTFIRSGIVDGIEPTYSTNYIFDEINEQFNGFTTSFTLKSSKSNITGFSTGNAIVLVNNIFQGPYESNNPRGDYDLVESSGITTIFFTGTASSVGYDVNAGSIPRGGIIVSVASTHGFGYQPLVSAGGTAIVSTAGTIQSISIGNSGSGYRVGIQTVVNVGVGTSSVGLPNIEFIGTASVSNGHIVSVAITNPGSGYTSTNPPYVFFDEPLSYTNIPLIYSSDSVSGIGTESTIDIVVGQGSSVINFEIKNRGYGYGQTEILTIPTGGTTGIPTNTSLSFEEFQITVDSVHNDNFGGWVVGDLQVIDPIDDLFNGRRVKFPIRINGDQTTIRAPRGSNLEVKGNLLIFINDILQVPDVSYLFEGGSIITFTEPPKRGDTSKIIFYRGTSSVDTRNVDILELVEEGDNLTINSDIDYLQQDPRVVYDIISTDVVETNPYGGPGVVDDETFLRSVTLCRKTEDKIINGLEVGKNRQQYEAIIQPTTNIIQNVSTSSTQVWVESVKTFFDNVEEYSIANSSPQKNIIIVSQDELLPALATANVSTAGTITSITITDGGVGYSTNPTVIIENPVGLGTTQRSTATSTISVGGTVSSISISNPGTGYTTSTPPVVLIEPPSPTRETINGVTYQGDFGIISGINTTSVGVASTGIVFDLFIPMNSPLRDTNVVGTAITVSGIGTDFYFVVRGSNIGYGVTSLSNTGSVVGVGSTFLDNIYQVAAVSIGQTEAFGVGTTTVAKVTVSIEDYNGLTGLGYSDFFGEYSFGRIYGLVRTNQQSFTYYNNGIVGVSTSPKVQRFNPLKSSNYNT